MPKQEIKLYYKNVMANVIGSEHGITPEQLKDLAEKTSPLIPQLNKERQGGGTPYRDLPYKSDISQKVKALVKELAPRCENLVRKPLRTRIHYRSPRGDLTQTSSSG